jgi:hypothetical protein
VLMQRLNTQVQVVVLSYSFTAYVVLIQISSRLCSCFLFNYSRRLFIWESKHRKHPKKGITEGQFGIVVPKATTTVGNFLTTCAVVDGS